MPKISHPSLPVSALFALRKPSGPTSMAVINDIKSILSRSKLFVEEDKIEKLKDQKMPKRGKRMREILKMGQGGTLDPLADGVLVIGINKATKKLGEFLDCTKEYQTTCLLGCETDTYDSEGSRVRLAPWRHVSRAQVESELHRFRGEIEQAPPIFSALKMDGKPLYEYARRGLPLPRPIEKRKVTVHSLEITEWLGNNHEYRWPAKKFSQDEKEALEKALSSVDPNASITDEPDPAEKDAPESSTGQQEGEGGEEIVPTAFVIKMTVSGGTYVRSIVHDLAHALGSSGHVVTLTRMRQGRFALEPNAEKEEKGCVTWESLKEAIDGNAGEKDEEGWLRWEREVLEKLETV